MLSTLFYGRLRRSELELLFAALLFLLATNDVTIAQDHRYVAPRSYDDLRLDWCLTWATDCGRPAALEFCNRRRFREVVDFQPERVEQTIVVGSDRVCQRGQHCTGFAYITCRERIPSSEHFHNPKWPLKDTVRLDSCREWAANCGKPAADEFCRRLGFATSFHSQVDRKTGYSDTRIISSRRICTGRGCRGYQQISCQR